jgi:hypothetical protein
MQTEGFKTYLLEQGLWSSSVRTMVAAVARIERSYDVDLDDEFDRDHLARILGELVYTEEDRDSGRPNPSRLDMPQASLFRALRPYRSHLLNYVRFRRSVLTPSAAPKAAPTMMRSPRGHYALKLERDLQAALRDDLERLESGLTIADGGKEWSLPDGRTDILARDARGRLTVIELKLETAKPEALTQILDYMMTLEDEAGEPVRGILVAANHHPRNQRAARAVPALALKTYRFRLEFE